MFAKYAINLCTHDDEVEIPPECSQLHHESELVVVMGKQARFISEAEAPDYIFGVAVGNDVSDETWYGERNGVAEPSRLISKACNTWSPLGLEIVNGLDYNDLNVIARLDGEVVAEGRTRDMTNGVDYVVSYLSQYMTLWPGDLIYMGTPPWVPGKREMYAGQTIECELEQVGTVRNKIVAQKGGIANPWWLEEMKNLPPPAEPPAPTPAAR
jgi:2-keto-4-pentenoate hydratase/2-oxohepta-3-ene-1,7-dioic acid hydratase in catechol pathway